MRTPTVRGRNWSLVEMFDLEWRLFEVVDHTRWLSGPHTRNGSSDAVALAGLREELSRPDWEPPVA